MIPISLKIENFLSHNNSIIDFSKFKSALIIGNIEGDYSVSNGSGKSAIMEGILWCLFNKSRVSPMDDIITWGKKVCRVELSFKHQNEMYKIIRTRNRQTSGSTVNLFKNINEEAWENISGSTSSLTNARITDIIKADYKTFINSVYFRQNDVSEFAEVEAGRRKEILKSIIDISKWDKYEADVKNILKDVKLELTKCEALTEGYTEIKAKLIDTSDKLISLEEKYKNNQVAYNKLNSELETLRNKYEEIKQNLDTNTWDKIVSENKSLKESGLEISKIINKINKELASKKSSIKDKKDKILGYEKKKTENPYIDTSNDLECLNKDLIKYKSERNAITMFIKEAKEKTYQEGICDHCEQDVSEDLYKELIEKRNKKLTDLEKKKIFFENKINEISLKIKNLKAQEEKNKLFLKLESAISSEKETLKVKEYGYQDALERLSASNKKSENIKNKINANYKILNSLKNDSFQSIGKKVEEMRVERGVFINLLNEQNKKIGILTERKNSLSKKIDSMKNYLKKIKSLKDEKNILEKLSKFYGKNGIQIILLNAIIEDLEKTSNTILNSICSDPFKILLETQRLGSDGIKVVDTLDLKVRKDGATQNFNSLSGGEKFRVCLAIRIALSEISSRHGGSSLDFLMLDEVNSPLDRSGTESLFLNVIRRLEDKYKILVITHNDSLKEKFNDIIDITKINGESSVKLLSL